MFCKSVDCAASNSVVNVTAEVSAANVLCIVSVFTLCLVEVINGKFVVNDTTDKLRKIVDCVSDDVSRLGIIDVNMVDIFPVPVAFLDEFNCSGVVVCKISDIVVASVVNEEFVTAVCKSVDCSANSCVVGVTVKLSAANVLWMTLTCSTGKVTSGRFVLDDVADKLLEIVVCIVNGTNKVGDIPIPPGVSGEVSCS